MDKLKLQENVFTQIAKLIATSMVKMNLSKAMKDIEHDPNIQASIESMKYHAAEAERMLKLLCKTNPDHAKCKEKETSK